MQGLTWANSETVLNELSVFRKCCSFKDLMATIALIVEEGVTNVFHMNTDLVCPTGLQTALDESDLAQSLEHRIMRDSMLALIAIGDYGHLHPVSRVATDISLNPALILLDNTPN